MAYITPEQAGVSSAAVLNYIKLLEEQQLSTHSLILCKGNDIFFEQYWKPFHPDFLHRMYSVTKSFVSLAIGFLEQDGMISLDDPIFKYYPEEAKLQQDENMKKQTIRNMLMMSTAKLPPHWFYEHPADRVKHYLLNPDTKSRPAGTLFYYDSTGSFVLGALVEKLTGKNLAEYLREKLFDKIGVSKEAYFLTCPGGNSWGDSALLCTSNDLLKVIQFVANKGKWNGEQILNEHYITEAVKKQIDNNTDNTPGFDKCGYGYLIWRSFDNSFFFNGMGCQLAFYVPETDMYLVYNGDNQGNGMAKDIIVNNFFQMISRPSSKGTLPENAKVFAQLQKETADLKLMTAKGELTSDMVEKINHVTYVLDENPMGISKFALHFYGKMGVFAYTNAQGDKEIPFGMGENAFHPFPQEGYSDLLGNTFAPGHYYDCATSGAWVEPHKLFLKVQVIDKYFGRLNIMFSFLNDQVGIYMNKVAEDFLDEYQGYAGGHAVK